jgi:hypothetical protein
MPDSPALVELPFSVNICRSTVESIEVGLVSTKSASLPIAVDPPTNQNSLCGLRQGAANNPLMLLVLAS